MQVYIFFNCDENKSETSMNLFYSKAIFGESKNSRRKLFSRVQAEQQAGRVKIADENIKKIESLIVDGNPAEASKFIQYGAIKAFDCM